MNYLLVVKTKKDNNIYFQKFYNDFNEMMKKWEKIDWESDKYMFNIYRAMSSIEIVNKKYGKDIKDILNDLIEKLEV